MLRQIHSKSVPGWRRVEPAGVIRVYRTHRILKHSAFLCRFTPKMVMDELPRRRPQGAALHLFHNTAKALKSRNEETPRCLNVKARSFPFFFVPTFRHFDVSVFRCFDA